MLPSPVKNTRRRDGFTLLESLVVIAIISVVASIVFVVAGKVKKTVNDTVGASNMRQLGSAIFLYAEANKLHFPNLLTVPERGITWQWDAVALSMLSDERVDGFPAYNPIVADPSDEVERPAGKQVRSYSINPVVVGYYTGIFLPSATGISLSELVNPGQTALLVETYDTNNVYNGGTYAIGSGVRQFHGKDMMKVLFCDGSVRTIPSPTTYTGAVEGYLRNGP